MHFDHPVLFILYFGVGSPPEHDSLYMTFVLVVLILFQFKEPS